MDSVIALLYDLRPSRATQAQVDCDVRNNEQTSTESLNMLFLSQTPSVNKTDSVAQRMATVVGLVTLSCKCIQPFPAAALAKWNSFLVSQPVWRLATVWTSNPGGDEIFRGRPDLPRGPPSLFLYNG